MKTLLLTPFLLLMLVGQAEAKCQLSCDFGGHKCIRICSSSADLRNFEFTQVVDSSMEEADVTSENSQFSEEESGLIQVAAHGTKHSRTIERCRAMHVGFECCRYTTDGVVETVIPNSCYRK